MLDRRNMFPHWWLGRPEDLPRDPNFRVRSDYLNANLRAVAEAIGTVLITGDLCTEGNIHYGASITTECRLTLPDDYTEVGDILMVADATRQWRIPAIAYENEIFFSDTHLIAGSSGGNDYNTIQNNLIMWTLSKTKIQKTVTKNEIVLGDFADGLHADDIQLENGDSTTIKAKLDLFDVEHESNGVHSDGIIKNDTLDKDDVLKTQGFVNRARNGAFNINGVASREYWDDVITPVVTPTDNGKTAFPRFSLQVATNANSEGIAHSVLGAVEAFKPNRVECYLWGDSGGEQVRIQIYDGIVSAFSDITLTTSKTLYTLDLTPEDTTTLIFRAISNTGAAQTWHIALVNIALGDIHTEPERGAEDILYDACDVMNFFVSSLVYAANQTIIKFTPQHAIKILRMDAYAITAVGGANAIVRLTDGSNDSDVQINVAANQGTSSPDQEYAAGVELELLVVGNAAVNAGGEINIALSYRQF